MTNILCKKYKFLLILLLGLFTSIQAIGQSQSFFHPYKYGKNRLQFKKFEWRYIESPHFEIYYYDNGYTVAKLTAEYVEEEFKRITELVGFSPYYKTKLLIYNSIQDLQQSNIGIYFQGYIASGQTRFIRPEVEIAFNGNKYEFQEELTLGISDAFIFEMMYGGSLKDMLKNSYLLNLPDWFMSGASLYMAEGWSQEMDDYMRDFFSRNPKVGKIRYLEGQEASRVGQSIWNYMAEKYGKANVSSVLNLTRIVRDEKVSIENTLGIDYNSFINDWEKFYRDQYKKVEDSYTLPEDATVIRKNRKEKVYNKISLSPDGIWAAYTENDDGKYKVKIRNMITGKTKTILKGGYRVVNQQIDYDTPIVGWIDNKDLVVFSQTKGKNYMWIYDTSKWGLWEFFRYVSKKIEFQFEHINDFSVAPDGNKLAISAERRGQSDIFVHDLKRRRTWQITKDIYDDLTPSFMPNNKDIVFSSNRTVDSTKVIDADPHDITEDFNIFMYKKEDPEVLTRLTNNIGKETRPIPLNNEEFTFLSSQKGITELYDFNLEDTVFTQLTDFKYSIKDYHIRDDKMVYVMFEDGKENIYYDDFTAKTSKFTPKTFRQEILDVRQLQAIRKQKELEELRKKEAEERIRIANERKKQEEEEQKRLEEELKKLTENDSTGQQTQTIDSLDTENKEDLILPEEDPDEEIAEKKPEEQEVDTDNYKFDTFSQNKRKSFLERYKQKLQARQEEIGEEPLYSRPIEYKERFTVEEMTSTLRIDPLRGWGLLLEPHMTDILENHKINAGLFGALDLNDASFYIEYEYLPKRFDYRAKFERSTLNIETPAYQHKYALNMLELGVSYPLTIRSRLSVSPFVLNTRFTDMSLSAISTSDVVRIYSGFNAEFVYDNSFVIGQNMMRGTRAKVRLENYMGLSELAESFANLSVDIRHYQKIFRSLTWATRLSGGAFIGSNTPRYRLGGMDNWMFNSIDRDPRGTAINEEAQDLSKLLFTRFAAPLRGFNYNKLDGQNYMLLNTEIRLPIVKFFTKKTVKSNFFRNLQFTAFFDIGTAWSNGSPFDENNDLNTEVIESGSFKATVKNFSEPFLMGHGAGARSTLLGYYLKFDAAWAIEDGFRRDKPKYYLTIGHDF
ncbi:hypothetical protein V6R21_11395 [Limibacter armeniacum]|uniref:hypothetical protein n=1 Tax=Limibacter armeniacum TaxID=466084 RepID=UPI002FE656DE